MKDKLTPIKKKIIYQKKQDIAEGSESERKEKRPKKEKLTRDRLSSQRS